MSTLHTLHDAFTELERRADTLPPAPDDLARDTSRPTRRARTRRTRAPLAAVAVAAIIVGGIVAGVSLWPTNTEQPTASVTVASFDTPAQLAAASEYIVIATITSKPESYSTADLEPLHFLVAEASIDEVVAQRPDVATSLTSGQTISLATELLDSGQSTKWANWSDLADSYPTDTDSPEIGDKIVAFLVKTEIPGYGDGYQAQGQALIDPAGSARVRALPGKMNHQVLPIDSLTTQVAGLLSEPAPWRDARTSETQQPVTSGKPASTTTS